jgi:hypothetical protein
MLKVGGGFLEHRQSSTEKSFAVEMGNDARQNAAGIAVTDEICGNKLWPQDK